MCEVNRRARYFQFHVAPAPILISEKDVEVFIEEDVDVVPVELVLAWRDIVTGPGKVLLIVRSVLARRKSTSRASTGRRRGIGPTNARDDEGAASAPELCRRPNTPDISHQPYIVWPHKLSWRNGSGICVQ